MVTRPYGMIGFPGKSRLEFVREKASGAYMARGIITVGCWMLRRDEDFALTTTRPELHYVFNLPIQPPPSPRSVQPHCSALGHRP